MAYLEKEFTVAHVVIRNEDVYLRSEEGEVFITRAAAGDQVDPMAIAAMPGDVFIAEVLSSKIMGPLDTEKMSFHVYEVKAIAKKKSEAEMSLTRENRKAKP